MDLTIAWAALRELVGSWEGTGRGEFPTIDSFAYREVLDITEPHRGELLQYRQQTWRVDGDAETESHIESGFIALHPDGTVEWLNVQGADRAEVLRGQAILNESGLVLELRSIALAHDPRMVRSWRTLRLRENTLTYEMAMATTAVPDGAPHLAARLVRH